jgi:uncharacterized protein involved in outer membrane biogenesis
MRWKWFVAISALIVIVLIASVYAYLNTYDYNKLKPGIARMVKDATGRDVTLSGAIDLAIGFWPELVVRDITFANASWASLPKMLKIDELQAQVRLLPLLFRNVELRHIGLKGVNVVLETNPDGEGNWKFAVDESQAKKAGASKAIEINIDNIRIENLNLTFHDGKTESAKRINLIDLKVTRQTTTDELAIDLRANYKGQPLTLSGKTGLVSAAMASRRFPLELSGAFSDAAIKLEGTLNNVLELKGIDVKVQASGENLAKLKLTDNIQLPKTNAFDIRGHLRGSKESLALNDASGNLSIGDINLSCSGSIGDLIALSGIDLKLNGSGKDLSEIGPIIGRKLPTTDEFSLEGTLTGSAKLLSLIEAQGNAHHGDLSLAMDGAIEDLLYFNGVNLIVKGVGRDLSEVGRIIDRKLPPTNVFLVEGRLTGSAKALSLKEAQGSAKQGSLKVTLSGAVRDLIAFSGLDLRLTGSGQNLAEIGLIIREKLPATDDFSVEGRLMGSGKSLSLRNAHGRARRGSLNLTVNGQVENLLVFGGMDLKLKGSGKDLAEIGPIIGRKLPATDEFAVEGRLTGSARSLSLQQARGSANRGDLKLMLIGGIEKLPVFDGINFIVKASGKELAEIGPLVGAELPELGPFEVMGRLSGSGKAISLNDVLAIVEKSDFKGLAKVEFLKRPKITVRLESSVIDFTALMKSLEKDRPKPANKETQKRRLFSDNLLPFDVLRKVDADIALKARNIRAKDARLEFGYLVLELEDDDFSIDKLEATYKETKISGNLQINAGTSSQVATNFLVQNFNLGDFLKETGKSDQVRAIVDIAAHGKSRGDSVSSLMANLNSSIGAVMGEGYLTRYLDLLSVGLSRKVVQFWGKHKKGGEVGCAVVQFDISNGIATSRAFVVDTEAGLLTVEGDMNLATEQVDFLLVPEPRYPSLMHLWTKLRVSGTMMDPTVRPDALSLLSKGARALSALAIGPLGLLAPFVHLGAHKTHPCDVQSIGQLGLNLPAKN